MPPKKQKKLPKNAFYFFMVDWKKEKEEQGQRFSGLREVADMCAEDWKYLPEYNRKKYKLMEAEAKKLDKSDKTNKFNSLGVSFDQIERETLEQKQAISSMESNIATTVERLSSNVDSLSNHYFFLVHANIYCYWGPKKLYIPCELAISKFNLKDGLVDVYHVFPAPFTPDGKIPLGYKSEVFSQRENVHGIPEPEDEEFKTRMKFDWSQIRKDVRKFLRPNESVEFPPLYTWDDDDSNTNCYKTAVINFFEYISNDSDDEFKVYSLPLFFFKFYGACQNVGSKLYDDRESAFPIPGLARTQLLKDIYNFCSGLACDFHEPSEFYHNCSLSFVKRWVFLICEFCCLPLSIVLIPGRHCLATAKVTQQSKPESSRPARQVHQQPMVQSSLSTIPQASSNSCHAMATARDTAESYASPPGDEKFDDTSEDSDGGWSTVSKAHHGMKNLNVGSKKVHRSSSESDDGAWHSGPKAQNGVRNQRAENKALSNTSEEILFIDRSKHPDPSKTRILRTGQSANVVSEIMPDSAPKPSVRLPISRGRGETLTLIASQQQMSPGPGFSSDDFPAIGGGRSGPGRQANQPQNIGWGRGFR